VIDLDLLTASDDRILVAAEHRAIEAQLAVAAIASIT